MPAPRQSGTPRVLVTGAGSAPGISAIKALADQGFEVRTAGHGPYMPGLYMVDRSYVLPRASDPRFADAVREVVERERIDVVLPVIDDEIAALSAKRHRFRDGVLAIGSTSSVDACLDKWVLHERVRDVLPVPVTRLGSRVDDEGPTGTCVVKPRRGSAAKGVRVLRQPPRSLGDDVVVQEHLPGDEVSVDVFVNADGQAIAAVPRMRLSTELGVSSCGCTFRDPLLEQLALDAMATVGLRGVANVQFRFDADGDARLLEINPRVSGGMALTVAAGANLPLLAVREALGERVDDPVEFRELAMVRYREEVFLDPRDLLGEVATDADLHRRHA